MCLKCYAIKVRITQTGNTTREIKTLARLEVKLNWGGGVATMLHVVSDESQDTRDPRNC